MAKSATTKSSTKRSTPMYPRAFRYRANGSESNRKVLVTAQNQNSLRGFDISEMLSFESKSPQGYFLSFS